MNKIDQDRHNTLSFLSKWTFEELKKKDPKNFKKYTEGKIWKDLYEIRYVTDSSSAPQIITKGGLEQLRILEDMKRKDLILIASVLSVVISLVSLAKSFGYI